MYVALLGTRDELDTLDAVFELAEAKANDAGSPALGRKIKNLKGKLRWSAYEDDGFHELTREQAEEKLGGEGS